MGRRAQPPPVDTLLLDGAVVALRPVHPSDEADLLELYQRTSAAALRSRFFTASPYVIDAEIKRLVRPPDDEHVAVVAVDRAQILAAGCWERTSADTAEFALLVRDSSHGHGIGTLMVEHLFVAARAAGIHVITADVLADNAPMLRLLRDLGMTRQSQMESGIVHVEIALRDSPEWQAAVGARESRAEHASLHRILTPRSVVVVGAGRDASSAGRLVLRSLVAGGFEGPLYAVNRDGVSVEGVAAARSVRDLGIGADVAVVAVPAASVREVVDDCAQAGVYGLVVISEGFADAGAEGARRQAELAAHVRECGMRLIGPNSLGVICPSPDHRVFATLSDLQPVAGHLGVVSQSGGVGVALLDALTARGLGVSSFLSVGNKADISGNDVLMYWEHDDDTTVCALYLESFGNPRKFARIARRIGRRKPVVVVTPRRAIGDGAATFDPADSAATPDVRLEALFAQAGVVHAPSLAGMLDILTVLSRTPLPEGRRVAVVSNSAGPAALARDACGAAGLTVVTTALASRTPGAPLAAVAAAQHDDPDVDAVLVVHASVWQGDAELVATELRRVVVEGPAKPLLAVFLGQTTPPAPLLDDTGASVIPTFAFPEDAAAALGSVTAYARWREEVTPPSEEVTDVDEAGARRLVTNALAQAGHGGWLDSDVALDLLGRYGIPVAPTMRATTVDEALAAGESVGFPVAVKAATGQLVHRTQRGAVRLDLDNATQLRAAVAAVRRAAGDPRAPLVVQPMLPPGVETAVRVSLDPALGPMLMVALGGFATELLADRSFRLLPLSREEARAQIRSLRAAPLLFGYRGSPRADVAALEDVVLRVARLAEDLPEVTVLDLNPVIVGPRGATVVDVKVRVEPALAPDPYLRRLSIVEAS